MALSMYAASVPVIRQMLGALSAVLGKGEAFATAKSIDPTVLPGLRLAPDMFPLSRQVQIATDMSKGAVARLAGADIPVYADDETTLPELQARLAKTLAFIETIPAERIDGSEDRPITITLRRGDLHFTGQQYLLHWAMPQIVFHCTTAYDILRHNGVDIGKRDFVGSY
jgi:hypothetical protein